MARAVVVAVAVVVGRGKGLLRWRREASMFRRGKGLEGTTTWLVRGVVG